MIALPAPAIPLLLPAPAAATPPSDSTIDSLMEAIKASVYSGTRLLFLDEAHELFSISHTPLTHHVGLMGTSGRGKSFPPGFASSLERGRTKLVAVGGDDSVLGAWLEFSPIDWTVAWQSWFPLQANEALPDIRIEDQSESCLLLAVDVAWTCRELEDKLYDRFPTLETRVSLAPERGC